MKAFVIQKPNELVCQEVPLPTPAPDEALVRVSYAGLCATDLAIYSGDMSLVRNGSIQYPVRFGHEWSGVVEAVGSNVIGIQPGDRVISESGVTCGVCEACQKQDWAACKNVKSLGTINCWDGAFAEYVHMPVRHLHKIPENVSLKEAAVVEPTCIALAGVKKANITEGKTVLVIGTGAIGLASVALAKYYGAERVFLSGRTDSKLAIGREMGADCCINTKNTSLVDAIMQETHGHGVDAVIETSGNINTISDLLMCAGNGAYISLIGFYEKTVPAFLIDEIVMKSLHVNGVMGEFGMPAEVLGILKSEKFSLLPLITHVIPFEKTIEAMESPEAFEGRVKLLVEVSSEEKTN